MRTTTIIRNIVAGLIAGLTVITGLAAETDGNGPALKFSSVKEFCAGDTWRSDHSESFRELREMTIAAGSLLDVDSGRNGGIRVVGENRNDILIRACVQGIGKTMDEAKAAAAAVKVTTNNGVRVNDIKDGSVSFEIHVPRSSNLKLKSSNGGISIASVEGDLEAETLNGGISITDAAGSVRGRTSNGGIRVGLTGSTWKGSGIDLQTTNGGIGLSVPETYAATIEARTANGGFSSDIPALQTAETSKSGEGYVRQHSKNISAPINGGGPLIKLTTTNGGIKITAAR